MRKIFLILLILIISCSEPIDIEATIDARAQIITEMSISKLNTPTPQPIPTAQPTPTPQPTPTVIPFQEDEIRKIAVNEAIEIARIGDIYLAEELIPEIVPLLVPEPTPQPTATPQSFESNTTNDLAYEIYRKHKNKVVMIEVGNSTGTGWIIEDDWVITNEHVVGSNAFVIVFVPDPSSDNGFKSMQGQVFGVDKKRDLAAIKVIHNIEPFRTRVVDVNEIGKDIFTIGYSAGNPGVPSSHSGIISYVKTVSTTLKFEKGESYYRGDLLGKNVSVIVFDAAADPGDSGGPIIDSEGNVVGIIYGFLESTSGKRVTGQQTGTSFASISDVWETLKSGEDTTFK